MKRLIIINAVVWAIVIIAASYFTKDHINYQKLFGVLIVAAGFQSAFLYDYVKKLKK